jgi:hypothetical protein
MYVVGGVYESKKKKWNEIVDVIVSFSIEE